MVPQVTSSMDICPGMWCTHSQDVSLLFHLFHLLSLYIYIFVMIQPKMVQNIFLVARITCFQSKHVIVSPHMMVMETKQVDATQNK
jgi:hypothetical protein